MEDTILKRIAIVLINNINESSKLIREAEISIKNRSSVKETNTKVNSVIDQFESIIKFSESSFVLPDKLVDKILELFIKFFDVCFSDNQLDLNIIGNKFIGLIIKFINIEQNYNKIYTSQKQYIFKKWMFFEKLLIFVISLIGKYDPDSPKFELQSHLNNIFDFVQLIYFSVDDISIHAASNKECVNKYRIMPGLISKMIKIMSLEGLKIRTSIIRIIIRIFHENMKIIFNVIEQNLYENYAIYLKSIFDFYHVFHLMLKDKLSSDKVKKITHDLANLDLFVLNEALNNKSKLDKILQGDYKKNILEPIFYFLSELFFKHFSLQYPDNFFSLYSKLFEEESVNEKFVNITNKTVTAISKEEFHKVNTNLVELFSNFILYISYIREREDNNSIHSLLEDRVNEISIFDSNKVNPHDKFKNILYTFYEDVVCKLINVKDTLIFEIINTFEIQINNVSKETALDKSQNLIIQCFKNDKEINFEYIQAILSFLYKYFPFISIFYFNLHLHKLNRLMRTFKKTFIYSESEEEMSIPVKEINSIFDELIKIFATLLFVYFYPDKNEVGLELNSKLNKFLLLIKQYTSYFANFLSEYQEQLDCVKSNKILLFNAILLQLQGFLMHFNKKMFNNNERNSILLLALSNYSNKMELLKYSTIFLLMEFTQSESKKLELKSFVESNFDFIITTTINKIIYFNVKVNNKKTLLNSISNYKLDVLNFFNSLILLLKDLEDENLTNFYCGELNKFIKKLFIYLDLYIREKNFFNLECLLIIIERITDFQNNIILRNWSLFKVEHEEDYMISEVDSETNKFVEFLNNKMGIKDSNLFRNIIVRCLPLMLSNKMSIVYKCIKIFDNLISSLYMLPMQREEKTNFSTEDSANVLVRSSLGPVMFESWGYFIYLLNNEIGSSATMMKLIIELFIKVADFYPKFFIASRLFNDLLSAVENNLMKLMKEYKYDQVESFFILFIQFLDQISTSNIKVFSSKDNFEKLIKFSENILSLNKGKNSSSNEKTLLILERIIKHNKELECKSDEVTLLRNLI